MDLDLTQQNIGLVGSEFIRVNFEQWLILIAIVLFLLVLLMAFKKIIRRLSYNSNYFDHLIYLVRLPKEKPQDQEKAYNAQQMWEEIARAETIFAAIGGLPAQRGFSAWLRGRNDQFSFEIVANKKLISFYAVAPRQLARYLEQQIQAHYPEAVMEEVEDYNIFNPRTNTAAGYLKTKRHYIFPLKTYAKQETDPMNSIINVMSKLEPDEGLAVQYIVRSSKASWHQQGKRVISQIHQGKTIAQAVSSASSNQAWSFLADLVKSAKPASSKDLESQRRQRELYKATAQEEEMLKGIEGKNAKAGLDVNLRIIVSANNPGKTAVYLDNLGSAFSQYNYYEYGNSFMSRVSRYKENKTVNDFIYRRFNEKISFLLNCEELAGLYHFPLRQAETPNILWLTAKHAAAPSNLPQQGIILGCNHYRGVSQEIRMQRQDRRRHTYIIGKSGSGKSMLLASLAIQDIINGEGVCIIDPHGDLINDVLNRIPPVRAEDVILFAPADIERPLALNLLQYDARYPEQKTFVINEMINIFDKLYDLKQTGGPIFEQYMRNAMLLIMSHQPSGSTLMEIPKVLADADFRRLKLKLCQDPTVVDFWLKEAEKAGGEAALANVVPYVTSKLTSFVSNDTMRPIIGQQNSSFNLRDIMDRQKILLVDLSKGRVGEMNAYLLGMILVGKILMSALSRTDLPPKQRKDFYLYIDEFQNFTTESITSILSEARKYNLNLVIAHQYLGQLVRQQDTSIKDAVFGNVGSWLVFKIGSDDAQVMEKEFAPVFNQYDLINIEKYTAYVKLLIDNTASRPFSMTTLWPLPGSENLAVGQKIKSLSRLKYGRDRRIIEAEITKRRKM